MKLTKWEGKVKTPKCLGVVLIRLWLGLLAFVMDHGTLEMAKNLKSMPRKKLRRVNSYRLVLVAPLTDFREIASWIRARETRLSQ